MLPSIHPPLIWTRLTGSTLILITIAALLGACSGQSESSTKTGPIESAPDEAHATTVLATIKLWVKADQNPPLVFGLRGTEKPDDPLRVIILEETVNPEGLEQRSILMLSGKPASFQVSLTNSQGHRLIGPKALLAVRDSSDKMVQRLFIVFESTVDEGPVHTVGELLIDLRRLETGDAAIKPGRIFNLPVRGSLAGISLTSRPEGSKLIVNVPASGNDPSQPVVLVYDISQDSNIFDPVDILMVPSK